MRKKLNNGWAFLWVAVIVIVVDQWTKCLAVKYLNSFEVVSVTSFFNLTLVFNTGAAFNFLSGHLAWSNDLLMMISLVVSVFIIGMLKRMPITETMSAVAYCCIVGGALGNLIDRVRVGAVVDFLDFHIGDYHWPAFNVADSAICVGVMVLIVVTFCNSSLRT